MSRDLFKIVRIVNGYTFVINGGLEDGINSGDSFHILDKKGDVVIDPDTGEVLGTLDAYKGKITAKTIYPKMTICETGYTQSTLMKSSTAILSAFSERIELEVNPEQITPLGFTETPVEIGDTVQKIKTSN